jgi:hypothetical protein
MRQSATVYATDHAFGLFDESGLPIETADWSTGLVVQMSTGAMIYTGVDRGYVEVTVDPRATAPDDVDDGPWDDIVEASVRAPHGELIVHQLQYGPHDEPPPLPPLSHHGPGDYRLRAHARGRDLHYDKVYDESGEQYLLTVWPAEPQPALIIRATDRCGYGLRLANLHTPRPAITPTPSRQAQRDQQRQAVLDALARLNVDPPHEKP